VFETGVTGLHPEMVKVIGKLRFRTSFGQNILEHSIEMSHLAASIAAELGANVAVAKRAALLHDLGKAIDFEVEGPHVDIGVDLCKRYGESAEVIHAVEAHHGDIESTTVEAVIVQCADAISSARPGARREVLENYVKRLKKLEDIGHSIPGVEKTFAVQAGREIRVMVKPEEVDDAKAVLLARETAKRIEEEMQYPGHIKVTVIRETRSVEYAK
jgi:ribonucrease Y